MRARPNNGADQIEIRRAARASRKQSGSALTARDPWRTLGSDGPSIDSPKVTLLSVPGLTGCPGTSRVLPPLPFRAARGAITT
jgi:hypothetical protein